MATKTIAISEDNYELLKNYGRAGDTFNDVITNLIKKRSSSERPQSDSRPASERLTAASTSTVESVRSKGDAAYE